MTSKKNISKNTNISKNNFKLPLVEKKIDFFKDVVKKTILHVQKNKFFDILGISDVSNCVEKLREIIKKIEEITNSALDNDTLVNSLQNINNDLSSIFKIYGTEKLEDLLVICFGNNNKIANSEKEEIKYEMLQKYFHPTSYKLANKKEEYTNKTCESIEDKTTNFICYDISTFYKQFHMKVYGMKVYIHNHFLNKSLIVFGIVDDIGVDFLNDNYIKNKKSDIKKNIPTNNEFKNENFESFILSLNLKDYLIYENVYELYTKYTGYISQNQKIIQKQINQIIKEFISDDMYVKRNTLINLLIFSSNYENQYLAYLLYDLLSNDSNGSVDTQEQTILFDSFPWPIKIFFKKAMKKTIQYTNDLSNFDINKIPLEQQICLLKANDTVKEKAMLKLKEVKSKSEDSGTKSRQYLDGLLKIPFSIYKREPILNIMGNIRNKFKDIYNKYNIQNTFPEIPCKESYTSIEILKYMKQFKEHENISKNIENIKKYFLTGDKKIIYENITIINNLLKKHNKIINKTKYSTMNKQQFKNEIEKFFNTYTFDENKELYNDLFKNMSTKIVLYTSLHSDIDEINNDMNQITDYMANVKNTLDKAVYGHNKAKKQIERIIGQWINGQQDGYCFGFEGPPGVGKTSMAKKGLSDCLKDDKGISRPFAMIQMGGDSNGSTLHGHNYTYVASTWGSIVQILMDKKCMNPIIFIDEVDKISKTEHGKEIVGILTHLLDPTQNDCFQDKYFSGIDLDLSKALFILSYNDVDAIDKILLDRVHRIKFNSLSLEDKLVICKTHILPEVYKKMGLEDMIYFEDEVLKFIIDEYTLESGVRKLKEILFEIVGEINLNILKNHMDVDIILPIKITIDDIKNKYFKDKKEVKVYKIYNESKVGVINALWANQMSQGGVLPIQANFVPSNKFLDLTLTGSMGDVMKESISVSLTNAWNLTNAERQKYLFEKYNDVKNNIIYGIHIHCPDISTKKDGPSATTAFTVLIYSLLNDIKIKSNFGITGETHFGLMLTEIGGLQEKIIYSIKSGIKEFIFPKENERDFEKIMEKYKDNKIIDGIKFHSIESINEVFDLILDK